MVQECEKAEGPEDSKYSSNCPRLPSFLNPCMITMRFMLIPLLVVHTLAACSSEFEGCVMNRDCCVGLHCAAGDWAYTTDSTCLSDRSVKLNALDMDEKVRLIHHFYKHLGDTGKTKDQVESLTKKYAYKREFAQLVIRLERKYGVAIDFEGRRNAMDEL